MDEDNRDGKRFECLECGCTVNADYNAAKHVGFRYLSDELSSPASHTCSSGQATSQLAFAIVLKAFVKRDALTQEEALEKLDEVTEQRDWLGAPIYRRARKLFE